MEQDASKAEEDLEWIDGLSTKAKFVAKQLLAKRKKFAHQAHTKIVRALKKARKFELQKATRVVKKEGGSGKESCGSVGDKSTKRALRAEKDIGALKGVDVDELSTSMLLSIGIGNWSGVEKEKVKKKEGEEKGEKKEKDEGRDKDSSDETQDAAAKRARSKLVAHKLAKEALAGVIEARRKISSGLRHLRSRSRGTRRARRDEEREERGPGAGGITVAKSKMTDQQAEYRKWKKHGERGGRRGASGDRRDGDKGQRRREKGGHHAELNGAHSKRKGDQGRDHRRLEGTNRDSSDRRQREHRGGQSQKRQRQHDSAEKGKGGKRQKVGTEDFHPSWVARQGAKNKGMIVEGQGKRVVFADSDDEQ